MTRRSAARITPDQILASRHFAIGTVDQIVDDLSVQRERHGISFLTVGDGDAEAFAPVVAQLAGR